MSSGAFVKPQQTFWFEYEEEIENIGYFSGNS